MPYQLKFNLFYKAVYTIAGIISLNYIFFLHRDPRINNESKGGVQNLTLKKMTSAYSHTLKSEGIQPRIGKEINWR